MRSTSCPLFVVIRDRRHGVVTFDNLRPRDCVVARIAAGQWQEVDDQQQAALIAAAIDSGAATPSADDDTFDELANTSNDFAHVDASPVFVCATCGDHAEAIGAHATTAPPGNVDAAPVFAICQSCADRIANGSFVLPDFDDD